MSKALANAETILKVLRKTGREDILYDLARELASAKLAGGWCGPFITEGQAHYDHKTGQMQSSRLEQWVRPQPDPRGPHSVAIIMRTSTPDEATRPYEWYAIPREVNAFDPADRKKGSFQYNGRSQTLVDAQRKADRILIEDGYWLDGRHPELTPWTAHNNHYARDFARGCTRSPDSPLGTRAIIVRQKMGQSTTWTWALLRPEANDKSSAILATGEVTTLSGAKNAADVAARDLGWDVPV